MMEAKFTEADRVFNSTNPNWTGTKEHDILFLQAQKTYFQEVFKKRGHLFLNDIYDALGFDRTTTGAVCGWWRTPGEHAPEIYEIWMNAQASGDTLITFKDYRQIYRFLDQPELATDRSFRGSLPRRFRRVYDDNEG